MTDLSLIPGGARRPAVDGPARDAALRAAATRLESQFLAEMLKAAGLGRAVAGPGGGGAGEAQFASFLAEAQAGALAERGGIGLAESLVRALSAGESDAAR
jgi:Rod binding domain-containing protein